MKTIKFRALDKRDGTNIIRDMDYIYSFLEQGCKFQGGKFDDGQLLWMQFTGLLDKNGKEIYEGDIIRTNGILEKVTIEHGSFKPRQMYVMAQINEVIGNIYENPELLN